MLRFFFCAIEIAAANVVRASVNEREAENVDVHKFSNVYFFFLLKELFMDDCCFDLCVWEKKMKISRGDFRLT